MTETETTSSAESTEVESATAPAPPIELDESNVETTFANYCRVTGTPEELIIDFALTSQPFAPSEVSVKIDQRLVTNYYTAKRFLQAMQISISRHEQAFGVLETDVRRRVIVGSEKSTES